MRIDLFAHFATRRFRQAYLSIVLACDLPPNMIPAMLSQTSALQIALSAQLLRLFEREHVDEDARRADRLLTVDEAVAKLAVTKRWLYTHSRQLPFTVGVGGRNLRFSEQGIQRYLRQQQAMR